MACGSKPWAIPLRYHDLNRQRINEHLGKRVWTSNRHVCGSRVGVTKAPFVNLSFAENVDLVEIPVRFL